jgi:hypothetical protein
MSVANILIRNLRDKKAEDKRKREAERRWRADNMVLIVGDFNKSLKEELEGYDAQVYINETQNNVDCSNGDKFFLTASKNHSNIRVVFRVSDPKISSVDYMKVWNEQMGILLGAKVVREGKSYFYIQFMSPQADVASTIKRIMTRVHPAVAIH